MTITLPKTIPAPARLLLKFIVSTEAPQGYDTIFGNRQRLLSKPLTSMTLGEVIDAQKNWGNKSWVRKNWSFNTASSAAGGPQFMRDTLIGLAKEIPQLSGDMPFDVELQDKLGYVLLLRRGYKEFMDGHMSQADFGKALAQEWASFPVLENCRGAHRNVVRGETYYAGDELNRALVKPAQVEALLGKMKRQLLADVLLSQPRPTPARPDVPAAPPLDHVSPSIDVDPENLDKPIAKSKTVWMWITTALGSAATIFPGIDWRVQLAILGLIVLFAVYAIKRRADLAKVVRGIKAELGDA